MIKAFSLFIAFSFFSATICSSASKRAQMSRQKIYSSKHRSAEFMHNSITPRPLARSDQSADTDQNFAIAISMNTCIGESLIRMSATETKPSAICPSPDSSSIPLLELNKNMHKSIKLLEKSYRALGILELVKKKYPENFDVANQIKLTLSYIYKLDPPTDPDGIPESARESSERQRRLQELTQTVQPHYQASPVAQETSKVSKKKLPSRNLQKIRKKNPIKRHAKKSHKKSNRTIQLCLPAEVFHSKKLQPQQQMPQDRLDITFLRSRLDDVCFAPASSCNKSIPKFMDSIYELINYLHQQLADLCALKNNDHSPRIFFKHSETTIIGHESAYQRITSSLLPLFTPLVEHYYSGLIDEESDAEVAICMAYKIYTHIQATGSHIFMSEQTAKDIDTCAMIVKGIETPRSKRKQEAELHMLYNTFTEAMSLIQKKQKKIIQDASKDFRDPHAWHNEHEISEQIIHNAAIELLTKLKRSDDLLRINIILSRFHFLTENPEIKALMAKATQKISERAQKERVQISPKYKPHKLSR